MIPVFRPSLDEREIDAIRTTFQSGWIGLGPKTREFEERFAAYTGSAHAVALNSATAALDLAIKAFDLRDGEIIVPAVSFVATAHAVLYNGIAPVFADVDEETLCMSVEDLQEKISDRTRAVIPVHLGGHPCDMAPLREIAEDYGLVLIEDAANAAGAEYRGTKVGTIGHAGCFSFQATKNMTTGDGGMITTSEDGVVSKLKRLRWMGIDEDTWERSARPEHYRWYYEVSELGYKCHMNDIQASMGLVQLEKLDRMNERRREIVRAYNASFGQYEGVSVPVEKPWATHAYWLYTLRLDERDAFMAHMAGNGIATSVHFMPLYRHPLYRKYGSPLPVAEEVWRRIVDLPLYPDLTAGELATVVTAAGRFFGGDR